MGKLNAYMCWLKENRENIKEEHFKNTSLDGRNINKELLKKAGQLWRNMSEVEKNKWRSVNISYKSKSKSKSKSKLKKSKKVANEVDESEEAEEVEESEEAEEVEEPEEPVKKGKIGKKGKKSKKVKEESKEETVVKVKKSKKKKGKRKLSSYIKWFSGARKDIINEHFPNLSGRELLSKVGKKGGELWRAMSEQEKNKYA